MSYVPALLLTVHRLGAQPEKLHVQWPKALGEAGRKLAANTEVLQDWAAHKVSPRVLQANTSRSLALEVVPALTRVLAPSIRALAPHLLSPGEQAALAATAGIMADYGLTFSLQDEGPGGRGFPGPR
ncbi:AAA domain-containing protein, partial [Haematococcus lacustris]